VLRERLDEDAVMIPYQMKPGLLGDYDLASLDYLMVQRVDVRTRLSRHDPQARCCLLELFRYEISCEESGQGNAVVERQTWLSWKNGG